MRIVILFGMLCSALLVGCGNSKLESAIYRRYGGESACPECPNSLAVLGHYDYRPIDRIKLEKTGFDNIYRAKVYVKCPKHGCVLSAVSEWYVSGNSVKRVNRR